MSSAKFFKKIKSMVTVTSCSGLIFGGICYYRNDEGFFDKIAMPLTRLILDAESAHRMAVLACKWNILPKNSYEDPKTLVRFKMKEKFRLIKILLLDFPRKHKFVELNLRTLLELPLDLTKTEKLSKDCTTLVS